MMSEQMIKLAQVLRNNKNWPLIVVGVVSDDFKNAYHIPAIIEEDDLYRKTNWERQLSDKDILLIDGMDDISLSEQEKFVPLIKNKRIGSFQLPDNVQIVMPVRDKANLSAKICSLSLVWEVK